VALAITLVLQHLCINPLLPEGCTTNVVGASFRHDWFFARFAAVKKANNHHFHMPAVWTKEKVFDLGWITAALGEISPMRFNRQAASWASLT